MLTQEVLKSILNYNPDTGEFTWKVRRGRGTEIGKIAGIINAGYRYIKLFQTSYAAHRLAFLYMIGRFPEYDVDHINGKKDDNRWVNLRDARKSENSCNRGAQTNNKLKVKGVTETRSKTYCAEVRFNNVRHRKNFKTIEDADMWAKMMRNKIHGDFVKHE